MISFLVMYPALSLALSGAGLVLVGLGLARPERRRVACALLVLAPVSPLLLVSLAAHLTWQLVDWALNACGPLSDLWAWAARQLASGGRR